MLPEVRDLDLGAAGTVVVVVVVVVAAAAAAAGVVAVVVAAAAAAVVVVVVEVVVVAAAFMSLLGQEVICRASGHCLWPRMLCPELFSGIWLSVSQGAEESNLL